MSESKKVSQMETTQSPTKKNEWGLAVIILIFILLFLSYMFITDSYIVSKMRAVCQNYSMDYSYKDDSSFYCLSTHLDSVTIKEIKYR